MSWLDVMVFIIFGGFLSLAFRRGVVLEVTEFLALILAGFMGFRLFRPISSSLHSLLFKGWSLTFLQRASFFLVFIVVFLGVFSIGLTIERRMKEEHYLEKITDQRMGVAFGFFKTCWLVCLILGMFFYLEMVPPRVQPKLKRGLIVSAIMGLRPVVAPTVYLMAPYDLAKDFLKVGYSTSNPKPSK